MDKYSIEIEMLYFVPVRPVTTYIFQKGFSLQKYI